MPAERIPLQYDVTFKKNYSRNPSKGLLQNLSMTGAFLATSLEEGLEVSEKISIEFQISGRRRKVTSKVIWKNKVGVGIQFIPTNNQDVQIIDDLLFFVQNKRETSKDILDQIFQKVA